ncbi:MAG: class I SAM-dependent methyltransferase [Desulfobacterales bacterium]|nr:class I SAM-dependent methyltransferase [Desulfobacterales bacterium]
MKNLIKALVEKVRKRDLDPYEAGEYSSGHIPQLVRHTALKHMPRIKGRVLDLGCGEGLLLKGLIASHPTAEVYGLDPWGEILLRAKRRMGRKVMLLQGDSFHLPFKDRTFSIVFCLNLFNNLAEKGEVMHTMREIYRVLAPEGYFLFDFRNTLNPFIYFGYKLAFIHDPDIMVPLKTHTLSWIKRSLRATGFVDAMIVPLAFKVKLFAPALVIGAEKR